MKITFEIDEPKIDHNYIELTQWLEFALGIRGGISLSNPLSEEMELSDCNPRNLVIEE